jgi:hypothetical protein
VVEQSLKNVYFNVCKKFMKKLPSGFPSKQKKCTLFCSIVHEEDFSREIMWISDRLLLDGKHFFRVGPTVARFFSVQNTKMG